MFCNRGKAYRALKRYAEARADFDEALRREPGHKHAIAELTSLAAVETSANRANATSGPPKTTSAQGELPADGRALEDWSVEDVTRWFKTKFAFSHKYQVLWEEQCISGALLPYLTETELKDDVDMKSSIHRNGALLLATILAVSCWPCAPFYCTSCFAVLSCAAVLRGIASLADSEKNRDSSTPVSPEKSGLSSSSAEDRSKKKRAAATDEYTKPQTPPKMAKSFANKTEENSTVRTSVPGSKAAQQKRAPPLAAAIAEGEAAAAALQSETSSQAAQAARPVYSEGTTRRLRDTLQQNRQKLEGRLAALEKRSKHLGALTTPTVGVENSP